MKTTMSIVLIAVCLGLSFIGLTTAGTASDKLGPKGILPDAVFTFEPVVEGTQVRHDFILYNKGDEPLKIIKVKSG